MNHSHKVSVQSLSRVRLFVTPWTAPCQASLSITNNSQSLLKPMSIESVMPSSHLILCRLLLLLRPIPPSIRVFSKLVKKKKKSQALLYPSPKTTTQDSRDEAQKLVFNISRQFPYSHPDNSLKPETGGLGRLMITAMASESPTR